MNKLILNAALALLARLPWDDILEVLKAIAVRKLNVFVLEQIDRLVSMVDGSDLKGSVKKQQVLDVLLGDDSPVRSMVAGAPGWLLGWAIDTAVLRLRTAGG